MVGRNLYPRTHLLPVGGKLNAQSRSNVRLIKLVEQIAVCHRAVRCEQFWRVSPREIHFDSLVYKYRREKAFGQF